MSALPGAVFELLRERGEEAVLVGPVAGGANSEAWELATSGGERLLAKRYPVRDGDEADRLGTEFAALRFLRSHGVRAVPEAVGALAGERIGLYEFVPGRRLAPGEVGAEEVRQAAAFLGELHALRGAPGAQGLPIAREACFSIAEHEALVRARLGRLAACSRGPGGAARLLAAYLDEEFRPELERVAAWIGREAPRRGVTPRAEIGPAERTLSPSDFGFHNALRRADGTLVFVDFEYFGWDDPAKTVADFFLQPAVPVPRELRREFFAAVRVFYDGAATLGARLPFVHALLSLKWRLIVLNPFLRPEAGEAERELRVARARRFGERARAEAEAGAFPTALD